jgi:hypothetical protein
MQLEMIGALEAWKDSHLHGFSPLTLTPESVQPSSMTDDDVGVVSMDDGADQTPIALKKVTFAV